MPRSASTPAWRMPAEWEKHERTWMAWPSSGYTLGETPEEHDEAREAWASVANAVVRFEPVTMIVDPADVKVAREWLDPQVDIIAAPLNDAWMRDIGPTFVRSTEDGSVAAVDWVFNGWGAQSWSEFDKDAAIAKFIAKRAGVPAVRSDMVNEGGGIHTDGKSTVLITETVQLDPNRNPGWTSETVEAELRRTLGVKDVVWFARGLTRDYEEFGTRGHETSSIRIIGSAKKPVEF
jgi:agmatine deiminase